MTKCKSCKRRYEIFEMRRGVLGDFPRKVRSVKFCPFCCSWKAGNYITGGAVKIAHRRPVDDLLFDVFGYMPKTKQEGDDLL